MKQLPYLGLSLCCALPVFAAETNLGNQGLTPLQQATGDAVQKTCGGFIAAGADPSKPLFATCRAMVHTANDLADNGGPTGDSLGLNATELGAALQNVATEEFAATESMAIEIANSRMEPMLSRLVELRSGTAGTNIASWQPGMNSSTLYLDGAEPAVGHANRLSGFFNSSFGTGERDETLRVDSFDYDSFNLIAGLDYRFQSGIVAGIALNAYEIDSDFNESVNVSGGDIQADGWGTSVYATWYRDDFYLDLVAGYASSQYDLSRSIQVRSNTAIGAINEVAVADTDSHDLSLGIGAGYDFTYQALTWGPYFMANYLTVDTDGYRETGADASELNLSVSDQEWDSLTSRLGIRFSSAISHSVGVIIPNGRIGWIHQYESDSNDITAVYIEDPRNNILRARTDNPDEDYIELGLGFSAVALNGVQAQFNYDTLLGLDELDSHLFSAGLRWEF